MELKHWYDGLRARWQVKYGFSESLMRVYGARAITGVAPLG